VSGTAVAAAGAQAESGSPSPTNEAPSAEYTQKVVDLLEELIKEVKADAAADKKSHQVYTAWYTKERSDATKVKIQSEGAVKRLTQALKEEDALRADLREQLDEVAGKLPSLESDLQEAVGTRKKENEEYDKLSSKLEQNIDGLRRSLVVLEKELPAAQSSDFLQTPAGSDGAPKDLLSIAQELQKSMQGSGDRKLNMGERELLSALFSAAKVVQRRHVKLSGGTSQPPQFLQLAQETASADPDDDSDYGEYESQTGGVTTLLENVLKKSEKQLSQASKDEEASDKNFKKLQASLQQQIETSKQRLADIKTQVAQSQERTGRKEADLNEAKELLKATIESLKVMDAQNVERNANYEERGKKRDDEILALGEAKDILTNGGAQLLMSMESSHQTSNNQAADEKDDSVAEDDAAVAADTAELSSAPSFLMLGQSQHRIGVRGASMEESSQTVDPFKKVRKLMQDMLERLNTEQAKDQRQKAWCDGEMRRTLESVHDKKKSVKKLTDEVEALDSEIETLDAEVPELMQELSDLTSALTEAGKARAQEAKNAKKAIQQYTDGQKPLKGALQVLQNFYAKAGLELAQLKKNAAASTPASSDQMPDSAEEAKYKAKSQAVAGVIGILEVALQDLIDLQKESEEQEAKAQKMYQEFKNESEVRIAVLNKDLEYKKRMKVRLESDRARAASDLKNYQKELEAVQSYLEQLKARCSIKGDSYEERKSRRESEIEGLQQALSILEGESF